MPAVLQTTMSFYVTRNAVTAGDAIREAFQKGRKETVSRTMPAPAQEKSTRDHIASA